MNRCSLCAWIPILPWPVWPLAGHARLGQNTVVGSMTIRLSGLCWGAYQEEVCLDRRFLCNLTLPRFSAELPKHLAASVSHLERKALNVRESAARAQVETPHSCTSAMAPYQAIGRVWLLDGPVLICGWHRFCPISS